MVRPKPAMNQKGIALDQWTKAPATRRQDTVMADNASAMRTRRRPAPRLVPTVIRLWQGLKRDLRSSYRPEQHYMRGPGPKWREKHAAG